MKERELTREEAVSLFEKLNSEGFVAQVYTLKGKWVVLVMKIEEKEDDKGNNIDTI